MSVRQLRPNAHLRSRGTFEIPAAYRTYRCVWCEPNQRHPALRCAEVFAWEINHLRDLNQAAASTYQASETRAGSLAPLPWGGGGWETASVGPTLDSSGPEARIRMGHVCKLSARAPVSAAVWI